MKTIFFKLIICLSILISFLFLDYKKLTLDKTYQAKQEECVKVSINNEVKEIEMDDYLLGVVAGEMPASFEIEAIKAQVVASRTYVYSRLLNVDNTTNSQVYLEDDKVKLSWQNNYDKYKEKVKKAISETKGEVITYQGEYISALFYSCSNGKSEDVENYFSGGSVAYLKSVDSSWDEVYDPKFKREKVFKANALKDIFGGFDYQDISYYPSGRVKSIKINNKIYTGREVREKLALASSDFKIIDKGNEYVFITKGSGHGVGMSQYGAQAMAKLGYSYQDILKYYYQGVVIEKNKVN